MGYIQTLRMKLIRARMFVNLIRTIMHPERTDLIIKGVRMVQSLNSLDPRYSEALNRVKNVALADSEFKAMYETNYLPKAPELKDLEALPEGSFGNAVFKHMTDNGLTFATFPNRPDGEDFIYYLSYRLYQDHDLWHVLFSKSTEVEEEVALQAVSASQIQSPISTMIIIGGLINLMRRQPAKAVAAFRITNETYFVAKKAKFLLGIKLHELFDKPLEEVRQLCGIIL